MSIQGYKQIATVFGLVLSLFFVFGNTQQVEAACALPVPTTAAGYEKLLRNTPINNRWYHGDSGQSVQLPNGKKLWVFSDTFSGKMNPDGTQAWGDSFVHNSALLTDKGCIASITGPSDANGKPTTWLTPTGAQDLPNMDDYYWVNTPYMDGNYLRLFLLHMYNDSTFHVIGADVATFDVSGATPKLLSIDPTPGSYNYENAPWWGAAIIRDNAYTYIYGSRNQHEDMVFGHYYYLARVPNGKVADQSTWRYWKGSTWTWSTNQSDAEPVVNGVEGLAASVTIYQKPDGTNVLISKKYDGWGTDIKAWTTPYLAWWSEVSQPLLAPVPNVNASAGETTYLGLAHAHATLSSGKLLVSWSLNSDAANFFGSPRYGVYFAEVNKP